MSTTGSDGVRAALRTALAAAMKQRDRSAMALYRSTLSAIDNAEAVDVGDEHRAGAVEASALGVGRTEAPRRALTPADEVELVRREVRDRRDAAAAVTGTNPDAARQLLSDADLLQTLLDATAQ